MAGFMVISIHFYSTPRFATAATSLLMRLKTRCFRNAANKIHSFAWLVPRDNLRRGRRNIRNGTLAALNRFKIAGGFLKRVVKSPRQRAVFVAKGRFFELVSHGENRSPHDLSLNFRQAVQPIDEFGGGSFGRLAFPCGVVLELQPRETDFVAHRRGR